MIDTVGERIRQARKFSGMTQADLAKAIHTSACSISNLENDTASLSLRRAVKLCEVLGVSLSYLSEVA